MITNFRECKEAGEYLAACQSRKTKHTEADFWEATDVELGKMSASQLSRINFRDLYEAFVKDGSEALRENRHRQGQGGFLREAAGPVGIGNFANIAGQVIYNVFKQGYESPAFIADQLFETVPATSMFQQLIPGLTNVGSADVGALRDDQEYPLVQIGEDWVVAPALERKGCRIEVTEETMNELRSFQLLEHTRSVGQALAIEREKTLLKLALDGRTSVSAGYMRKSSTAIDVYQTSSPYDNVAASNGFTTAGAYGQVDAAELTLTAMTDPNTGDPINVGMTRQIVFPVSLRSAVYGYLAGTGYNWGDADQATTPIVVVQGRSLASVGAEAAGTGLPVPVSNVFVSGASEVSTSWFYGDFKKAFKYREMYPIQVIPMPSNYDATWTRDVVAGFVARRFGSGYCAEPRHVVKCLA